MTIYPIESSLPAIQNVLRSVRGGVVVNTASNVLSNTEYKIICGIPPKGRAVIYMAIAMSIHYLGYSFARPSTIAIFTSFKTGYKSLAAFPLAMAFVSPVSLLLLMAYNRALNNYGPKGALTCSTLGSASVLILAALSIRTLHDSTKVLFGVPLVKYVSGPLFIFRESYVQLITSQYWSFMSSVLDPQQSSRWFAPISGLTSITSALAGLNVSRIVGALGLPGAVVVTGLMMILSLLAASRAYIIADKYGFNPSREQYETKQKSGKSQNDSLIKKASDVFHRVPTLWALFIEVLSSQGLATLLNVCFVTKLSSTIPNDVARAGWMGNFFALINVITMIIQFSFLPLIMQAIEPKVLWRVLPIIMLGMSSMQAVKSDPSLYIVAASVLMMKTLEYSARRMLDEMVYVPLDFQSRYIGKEVVGVLAYRMGKSSTSLLLSALTTLFGNFNIQRLSILSTGASVLWLKAAWDLSRLVPTKQEASNLHASNKKSQKK